MSRSQKYLIAVKKSGFSLSVTQFTQSLGAELLTNGNFASGLTGWTLINTSGADPEITEVGAANTHGGGGTGAANLYNLTGAANRPALQQAVFTAGSWYEFVIDLTAYAAGEFRVTDANLTGVSYSGIRTYKRLIQPPSTLARISGVGLAPTNLTVDNASIKAVTQNAVVGAVPTGVFTFQFTPGTLFAANMIAIMYRMQDASNYMVAYALRNGSSGNWDMFLDSVAANSPTTLRTSTNAGVIDAIRVTVTGNSHQLATGSSGVFTNRGAAVSSSLYNTSSNAQVIYSSSITPVEFAIVA